MKSKDLLKIVIDSLCLYAPVFEDGPIVQKSAYTSSPIMVQVSNRDTMKNVERVDFKYSAKTRKVTIGKNKYVLNKRVSTPFGKLRFVKNPNFIAKAKHPLYFSVIPVEKVLNKVSSKLKVSSAGKLSTVLYMTFRDEVPERGKDILNLLIDIYNQEAIHDKNLIASNTLSFVEKRMRHVVRELPVLDRKSVV